MFLFDDDQTLDNTVQPILNKPKPKVEPPKAEEKSKDKPNEEQKSHPQNSQSGEGQNANKQQAPNGDKMDVE